MSDTGSKKPGHGDKHGDEVVVAVVDADLAGSGVRRTENVLRDLGTALAHTVVVDATHVAHIGARGLMLLDHWVHHWQTLNLRVRVLASHSVARAVGAAGGSHVVRVTYASGRTASADDHIEKQPPDRLGG